MLPLSLLLFSLLFIIFLLFFITNEESDRRGYLKWGLFCARSSLVKPLSGVETFLPGRGWGVPLQGHRGGGAGVAGEHMAEA